MINHRNTEFTEAFDLRMTGRRRSCEPLPHDSSDFSPSFQAKQSRIGRVSGEKFELTMNNTSELRLTGMVRCCPKGQRGFARSSSPGRAKENLLSVPSVSQWLAIFKFHPAPDLGTEAWNLFGLVFEPFSVMKTEH